MTRPGTFHPRFFLMAALALFLSFGFNLGRGVHPGPFKHFGQDSERLVHGALVFAHEHGFWANGGFLYNEEIGQCYKSQAGFHGVVFNVWRLVAGKRPDRIMRQARVLSALLLAVVLAAFLASAAGRCGTGAAFTGLVCLLFSDWLILFALNAYWLIFLDFLPFVLSWLLYPLVVRGKLRLGSFVALLAAAVCLKSLCGYEYISNVVLGAAAPIIYYEVVRLSSKRDGLSRVLSVICGGSAGFAMALLLHFLQGWAFTGSAALGWEPIVSRAMVHTVHDPRLPSIDGDVSSLTVLSWYGKLPVLSLPLHETWRSQSPRLLYLNVFFFFAAYPVVLAVAAVGRWLRPGEHSQRLLAFALATGWGAVAASSWAFAARAHMCYHIHLNTVIFYIPFLPMMYLVLGMEIQYVIQWMRHVHRAPPSDEGDVAVGSSPSPLDHAA